MTSDARQLSPAIGSAWQSARLGQPRPLDAGTFVLVTPPTSPFWARRHTRFFLNSCRGITESTAETAELLASELVINAGRFSNDPPRTLRYSERADASLITLSPCLLLPGDKMIRNHDVSQLTTAELERAKRELQANLGLIAQHSPAHVPIQAQIKAIDKELAERAESQEVK